MTQVSFLALIPIISLYFELVSLQTSIDSTINESENPYFRSGTVDLILSNINTDTNTTTDVTYAPTLMTRHYQLMTSITSIDQGIDTANPTIGYNITVMNQKISMFRVRLYSVVMPRITFAKLTYLCIDNAIRSLQFYVITVYFGDGIPGLLQGNSVNTDFIFNFTSRISRSLKVGDSVYIVKPFIKGFKIINHNSLGFSIDLSAEVLDENHFRINVRSSVFTTQQVTDLYVQVMVYNQTRVQSHVTILNQFNFNFPQTDRTYNDFSSYKINQSNFYLGVQGFRFMNPTYSFFYDFFFNFPTNQVQLNGNYLNLKFITTTILSMQLRQCKNLTYQYFMNLTYKCYSSCPTERRYEDDLRKQCAYCMYDCYTCENGVNCTSCNDTKYFRENDLTETGILRCKPISGYYNTKWNNDVARRCDSTCVQCILQATNCSACQSRKYLSIVDQSGSCHACPPNCTKCIDSMTCTQCDNLYGLDSSSMCVSICTENCSLCHIATIPVEKSVCDECKQGFHQNSTQVSECHTICGDGIFIEGYENCQDNNTQNGDGCDSQCNLQLGYNCYSDPSNTSMPQQCYYEQQVRFSFKKMQKYPKRNTFKFDLSLWTLNPSVLNQLNWQNIISIDIDYFSFTIINRDEAYTDPYNLTIGTLVLTFEVDYKPTIKSTIQIQLDPKRNLQPVNVSKVNAQVDDSRSQYRTVSSLILNPNKFDTTPITKQTLTLKSENGMAFIYESDQIFTMAIILEYSLMVISGLSLLLVLFSFTIYGGKILTLEWLFAVSCAYFSLVGFENLQVYSTVEALSGLKLISLNMLSTSYDQNTRLWWAGISNSFINNCLGFIVIIGLGLIYLILMAILQKKISYPESITKFQSFKKYYSTEEVLITLYMITAYGLTANLLLSMFSLIKNTYSDVLGLILGILLLIVGIVLFILIIKKHNSLWEYKDNFYLNSIHQYYINFSIIVLWCNSIFLVTLKDTIFGNIFPILFSIGWIIFLVFLKPFRKDAERQRPIIVQVFNILVQGFFLTLKIKLTNNDQMTQTSAFFLYLPFMLAIILGLGLGHTIFCFVKKIKNAIIDRRQFLENQKLFQITKAKFIPTIMTSDSSQKQVTLEPCIGKEVTQQIEKQIKQQINDQIMESFRKQKGFNFISHTLEYGKQELQDRWAKLENMSSRNTNVDIKKAKQIKKQIKKSIFLEGNKIESYFKFRHDLDSRKSLEQSVKKPKDWQSNSSNSKEKQNLKSQNEQKSSQQETKHEKEVQEYIKYSYETQKYKQEWKSFFKPKTVLDDEKKHSLAIYDMI